MKVLTGTSAEESASIYARSSTWRMRIAFERIAAFNNQASGVMDTSSPATRVHRICSWLRAQSSEGFLRRVYCTPVQERDDGGFGRGILESRSRIQRSVDFTDDAMAAA